MFPYLACLLECCRDLREEDADHSAKQKLRPLRTSCAQTRNEPCFHVLCLTATSQAAKQFPLRRCILADESANTLMQRAECLDFELGKRRMIEPRDEHNAHRVALVPRLMLKGIVEYEATSLTPGALFVPHANAAALGHD